MRVLITGGFGFIGGRLGQNLQQAGHQVVLATRRRAASPSWLPQAEVMQLEWDEAALSKACVGVDAIVHGAGMNAQQCAADPVAALEFNGRATARLVRAAADAGVRRMIALSTAHVYANPLTGVITEATSPTNMHPYATSHRAGDEALLESIGRGQIGGVVVRLSNAFGAPAHKDADCWMLLVNELCREAVQSRKMVLRSNGLQQRDFIPMRQACMAIAHLLNPEVKAEGVVNVGAGASQSVLEMARLISRRCLDVLKFEPDLQVPSAAADQAAAPLEYRIDALTKSGFRVNPDPDAEIDQLLKFCQAEFAS